MKLKYKFKKDLIASTAINFVFGTQKISSGIYIIINNKRINAKSLLNILKNKIEKEKIYDIEIEKIENIGAVRNLFSYYAEEV